MRKWRIPILLLICLLLASCAGNGTQEKPEEEVQKTEQEAENMDTAEDALESAEKDEDELGEYEEDYVASRGFAQGPADVDNPLESDGENLFYEFWIESYFEEQSEFGLALAVDGYPQLSNMDGERQIFHYLSLNHDEGKINRFALNKEDLILDDGEEHVLQSIVIYEPRFEPEEQRDVAFEGSLSSAGLVKFTLSNDGLEVMKDQDAMNGQNSARLVLDRFKGAFVEKETLEDDFDIRVKGEGLGIFKLVLIINDELAPINGQDFYVCKTGLDMEPKVTVNVGEQVEVGDRFYFLLLPAESGERFVRADKTATLYVQE